VLKIVGATQSWSTGPVSKKNKSQVTSVRFPQLYTIKATGYGLDGPGIESRWGEIFRTRPDRP
jgi:hypothetical protein